jgi:triosephosphate isomerase
MIVVNLKTYQKSLEKALYFTDIVSEVVEETGLRIIICQPTVFLKDAAERFSGVFSQYVDPEMPGAFTGSLPVEALKIIKVSGSLINHSEKKIDTMEKIRTVIERLHQHGLESLACAETPEEAEKIVIFHPTYIAIEPPELIGSGVSVSTAKPEIVKETVRRIKAINDKIPVLCGAGISNANDVKKSLELGSDGVLLASAFVHAEDPKEFLRGLAAVF